MSKEKILDMLLDPKVKKTSYLKYPDTFLIGKKVQIKSNITGELTEVTVKKFELRFTEVQGKIFPEVFLITENGTKYLMEEYSIFREKRIKQKEKLWWKTIDKNNPYICKLWSGLLGSYKQRISQLYIIREHLK